MTRLEAFGVQCFLLLVVVGFGVANLAGIKIDVDNTKWIEKIWDIVLLLLAPGVFSTALQQALNPTNKLATPAEVNKIDKEINNEKTSSINPAV